MIAVRSGLFLSVLTVVVCVSCDRVQPNELYVSSRDLYVSSRGSDNNPCLKGAPCRTIPHAASLAAPGTTVHVAPGTYPGGIITDASGNGLAPVRYVSEVRWGAKIVPPRDGTKDIAWENKGHYVEIDGFEVDGSEHAGGERWYYGIYTTGAYSTIRNSYIHHIALKNICTNMGGAGIEMDSYRGGYAMSILDNVVHHVGPPNCTFIHGIYATAPGEVSGNVVYGINGVGIHLWHDANHILIRNNTIFNTDLGILVGGGDFHKTGGPADFIVVEKNIVYDNRNGIKEDGFTGVNNVYRYNLLYNNGVDWVLQNGLTPVGTIRADPQFINYIPNGGGDYGLLPESPVSGAGIGAAITGHLPE